MKTNRTRADVNTHLLPSLFENKEMAFKNVKLCKSEQKVLCTYCPNKYCVGKVKYKLIMRMGGDLFELELYHKIIKKMSGSS